MVRYETCFDYDGVLSRIHRGNASQSQRLYRNVGQLEFIFRIIDKDRCARSSPISSC